jgi:hypothetical protein
MAGLPTLILHARYTTVLSYNDDWLDAFKSAPKFSVAEINICERDAVSRLRRQLRDAKLVVLLHSTNGDTTSYLDPLLPVLADRKSILVSFVGNEVNLPGSPIAAKRSAFKAMAPDFIATQLPLEAGEYLWGDLVARRVLAVPHALNPAVFRPEAPVAQRPIDIGVRAVRYVAHLGDDDRNRLHDLFTAHTFAPDLRVDISSERLSRANWARFLNSCKGTVSTEAGSWFLERDDATVEAIRAWVVEHYGGRRLLISNDSRLRRLGHKMPWWLRAVARRVLSHGLIRHESTVNEDVPFAEVDRLFFANRARPAFYGKCISSRHFDAIGTGTCQILVRGRYNDILRPGEHYIALDPDYANLQEAIAAFRDPAMRTRIATAAREHVLDGHTYLDRVNYLHSEVVEAIER